MVKVVEKSLALVDRRPMVDLQTKLRDTEIIVNWMNV